LNNSATGAITSNGGWVVGAFSAGQIVNINNAGTIASLGNYLGNLYQTGIANDSQMQSLINTGSIYTEGSGNFGIINNNALTD